MSYDKLSRLINQCRNIDKEFGLWLEQDFLPFLKRKGAESRGSQANYVQAARKLYKHHSEQFNSVSQLTEEELFQLNQEIADKIKKSVYRETEGDNNKRRKRHQWTTWKRILEVKGWNSADHQEYIPTVKFSDKNSSVNRQADTKPEDIPSFDQFQEFLENLRRISGPKVEMRNQAMMLLMWDKGPRIGELLSIKNKHVQVSGRQVKVKIPGNKGSKDRTVEVLQGRKTIKDYYQGHPARKDGEAYFFCNLQEEKYRRQLQKTPLRRRVHKAAQDLDFKTSGEPFHIFRKAMVTTHILNDWATWEQICTWHGKSGDSTKPDYLKMALTDVDASVAGKMGVEDDVDRSKSSRMLGEPMLPYECSVCGRINRVLSSICNGCGEELTESDLPKSDVFDGEQELDRERLKNDILTKIATNPDLSLNDVLESELDSILD